MSSCTVPQLFVTPFFIQRLPLPYGSKTWILSEMIVLKMSFLFNPGCFSDSMLNFGRVSSPRGALGIFLKMAGHFRKFQVPLYTSLRPVKPDTRLGMKTGNSCSFKSRQRGNVAPPNENRVEAAYQPFCCLFFLGGNLQIVGFRGWRKES